MKVVKARCESKELLMFRSLNLRMELSASDRYYYSNLEKGYEGECKFDQLVERHLSDDWLAVNDLLLENHNRIFQIDSLLTRQGKVFLNDVKNFDGDYYIKDGKWYTASGNEIEDPLEQLTRCESKLRRLLGGLGFSVSIESRLVFVNPEFYLYQAPLNLPIVFPAHLNSFMNQLNLNSGKVTERDFRLAQKLASLNIEKPQFTRVPKYNFAKLKKGIISSCHPFFMKVYSQERLICPVCGCMESVESAVVRNVEELTMLFPDLKITTPIVHEWCEVINSKRIWRVLSRNFELIRSGKSSYYIKKKK